jgi:hypothetical protein
MIVSEEMITRFAAAMERVRAKHPTVTLCLGLGETVSMVSQLQLALRHPRNRGATAEGARRVLDQVIAAIASVDAEAGELLRLGNQREYDMMDDV